MSVIGPNIESDLSTALEKFLDQEDKEGMIQAYAFLSAFKDENELLFVNLLSQVLGNEEQSLQSRTLSALFIFRTMKRRNLEEQRAFINAWHRQEFEFRENVRAASLAGLMNENINLSNNCASLLGLDFAIEFCSSGIREQCLQHFIERFYELLEIAGNGGSIEARCAGYSALEYFGQYSLEFNGNCAHEQTYMRDLVPNLFECIMAGVVNGELPNVQAKAAKAMLSSLLVFKRHLSFPQNREALISVIFDFLASDDLISSEPEETYFSVGYSLISRIIDYFYPYVEEFIDKLVEQTGQDMECGNQDREIEACLVWSTIGEVESDIKFPQRKALKNRKHHEYDQCLELSSNAFAGIFPALVQLIMSMPEDETDANVALDRTTQNAAFSCISELSVAADQTALELMFEFVKANIQDANWTLRYTSILLLNAASQLDSFEADIENILTTFDLFVQALEDEIPRNIEVAMWSIGRMIEKIPELITDSDRFEALTTAISQKMEISSELTSRACWLYNRIFSVFSPGEDESLIALNFPQFSTLLLEAADVWPTEVDSLEAAYGALNKLIERTPAELVEPYNRFLEQVLEKLQVLVETPDALASSHALHKALGLCSFVQAIVMNIGPVIQPYSAQIIEILLKALNIADGNLICEALPALGAVARVVGAEFVPYLQDLIPQLQEFLSVQETVQFGAVFVSDIYSAIDDFPQEITETFVDLLFKSFKIDDLSAEGRVVSFSALTEIAKQTGPECLPWVDKFLEMFERESKSALSTEKEQIDPVYVNSFSLAILQCYQTLVPLYATVEKGDRRVRNFFHIYDKLVKILDIINDDEVIMEAVLLVKLIADTFGRRVNVYINKPVVRRILQNAGESENPALREAAEAAEASISAC